MELKHSFTVPVPMDRAWDVLLDVERVAPCMPGATLDAVDGDDITGRIKVKVGPISMTYAGRASITERDREAGVVTLEASGKETRGAGTASASIRSELSGEGDETHVTVLTNLNVTGKPAQFGRGVMSEVSGKLIGIFADNLAKMLAAEGTGASVAAAPQVPADVAGAGASSGETAGEAAATGETAATGEAVQVEETAQPEPVEPEPAHPEPVQAEPAAAHGAAAGGDAGAGQSAVAELLALPIEELGLPLRAYNSLRREGVHTVGDLVAKTPQQLLAIENIGPASVEEIRQRLADRGLTLGEAPMSANGAERPAAAFPAAEATPKETPAPALHTVPAAETEPSWQADNEAIDLLSVAGFPVLKRAVPVAVGAVVVAIITIGVRRRLRSRR
jgi:carbon monoxide dehydrogenase subunit G